MPPDLVPHDSSFGDLLRAQRLAGGLTQAELAERAGLSVRGLSDLERGVRTRPQRETVQRLLEALAGTMEERIALQRAARTLALASRSAPRVESGPAVERRVPQPAGRLLGRAAECEALREWLLEPMSGIVTLTGPGGCGKTRLAIALANDDAVARRYPDGIVFVDLAAVRDARQVLPALVAALGWVESAGSPTPEMIARRLQGQRMCLLLDNFEQVIVAAPVIAQLAALLPTIAFLVTSREPLRVRAERCLPVAPLQTPDSAQVHAAAVLASPSGRLFAERAQAAYPAFTVTEANAREVALLCQRLDGLPLAIELAASLTALHTPATLLRRLADHEPLPGTLRDLPARQRTLESVVAWSEALLLPVERRLFHVLGVFDGGFSLEALQQVWTATRSQIGQHDADGDPLALLGSLMQRSLVQREAAVDEPRYQLLETIRAVATARFRASPDRERVAGAHAAAMHHAAEAARLGQRNAGFDARLRHLERDLPNLRAALRWLAAHDLPGAVRLLDTLGSFWALCGHGAEGLAQCEVVLDRYTGQDPLRGRLARHAAWLATNLGEFASAERHIAEASRVAEALGDAREGAYVWFVRGNIAQGLGRAAEAEQDIARALPVFEACDETWAAFACHAVLGMVALDRGDAPLAEARFAAALRQLAADAAARDRATVLCNIAVAQRWQGKLEEAASHAAQALALTDEVVAWSARAGAWQVLARVALQQGDRDSAGAWLRESLHHWQRSGDQKGLAACIEVVAAFAAAGGEAIQAVTLFATVAALREQVVGPAGVLGAAECAALEESLRATLPGTQYALAAERGRLLAFSQVLALAQTRLERPA